MKQINLIMVTENNNNKFYNMQENEDGTFSAKWGRVGATENTTIYPIEKWDKQYKSKIKKGYKDISSLKIESKVQSYKDLEDKEILNFLFELQKYSKQWVRMQINLKKHIESLIQNHNLNLTLKGINLINTGQDFCGMEAEMKTG